MKYVSGLAALNTHGSDVTCGDWHGDVKTMCAPLVMDTESSPLGSWDVGEDVTHEWSGMPVAGHMRACLDLVVSGRGSLASGMRHEYLGNDSLDDEVFGAALVLLRGCSRDVTDIVDAFMASEYRGRWVRARKAYGNGHQ